MTDNKKEQERDEQVAIPVLCKKCQTPGVDFGNISKAVSDVEGGNDHDR